MKPDEIWPPPPMGFTNNADGKTEGKPKATLILGVIGTGLLLSATLGAFTNAINVALCPDYFYALVFNQSVEFSNVPKASILQGIWEAAALGLLISGVLAIGADLICRPRLSYNIAFRCLVSIVGGTFLAWILGGLLAVGLAAIRPALFGNAFGLPGGLYAWVFGSVHGIEPGSLASLVIVLVRLYIRRPLVAIPDTAAT